MLKLTFHVLLRWYKKFHFFLENDNNKDYKLGENRLLHENRLKNKFKITNIYKKRKQKNAQIQNSNNTH